MNDDQISRRAAIDDINKLTRWSLFDREGRNVGIGLRNSDVIRTLFELPAVQTERPKGEWIYGEHNIAMCDGYWCNQCGFFVPWDYKHKFIDFIKDYHWCPSCGADMRGERDERSD